MNDRFILDFCFVDGSDITFKWIHEINMSYRMFVCCIRYTKEKNDCSIYQFDARHCPSPGARVSSVFSHFYDISIVRNWATQLNNLIPAPAVN